VQGWNNLGVFNFMPKNVNPQRLWNTTVTTTYLVCLVLGHAADEV
jgi:hypothetical protein